MISFIRGKISSVGENIIVIETSSGLGFELIASTSACARFNAENGEVKIETYMQVREDSITLFGFENKIEKEMFLKLITVSGVGPKLAITILSGVDPNSLSMMILNGDTSTLAKVKGLGKKTAEKIILELRGNVGRFEDIVSSNDASFANSALAQNIEDAASALTALGISKTDAIKMASKVATQDMSSEDIIRKCLREMGR